MKSPLLRLARGTTLVEVLVVIVILTVGILAVIQIFPKGFQVLSQTRAASQAAAIARAEGERLKAMSDKVPEAILPVNVVGGSLVVDSTLSPDDLSPLGDEITTAGVLTRGGEVIGPWGRFSGANKFRRILGESAVLPSPRRVGATDFGSLMLLEYGPVDTAVVDGLDLGLLVTTSPLNELGDAPTDLAFVEDSIYATGSSFGPFDYFTQGLNGADPSLYVPAGTAEGQVAIRLAVTSVVAGQAVRTELRALLATVGGRLAEGQLSKISLAPLVTARLGAGTYLLDPNSLRVAYRYRRLAGTTAFGADDPFTFKLLSAGTGALLFNPVLSGTQISRGTGREPLGATIDYTVADWRNLRADVRVTDAASPTFRLPLGRLVVGGDPGTDGRLNGPLTDAGLETAAPFGPANSVRADNFVLLDTESGGVVCEVDPARPSDPPTVIVDKSSGLVTFVDVSTDPGLQGRIAFADGTVRVYDLTNRALRVLYRVRDEWAVAPLKAAATYSQTAVTPGAAQFQLVGNRLIFPRCDAGMRVTIGAVAYIDRNGARRELTGIDALVAGTGPSVGGLPFVDLTDRLDGGALQVDGLPIRDVRGASVVARVVRNSSRFTLGNDAARNIGSYGDFARTWQRSRSEINLNTTENSR